jgi:hypothetical protein
MDTGKKAAIAGAVILVLAVGTRVGLIYKERRDAAKPVKQVETKIDPDFTVFLKQLRPDSLKDEKALVGKTIWVSAGGQMDYYTYTAHKADYSKSAGLLLGAEPLVIKDAFEQVEPKTGTSRIPAGDKQVLLAFTMPKSSDPAKEYAVPVGYKQGTDYTFLTDEIFFYDDPHQLYSHWGSEQWAAIDQHRVIPGMSERQVALSLGQASTSGGTIEGDRTVTFDHQGHLIDVTFAGGKATVIRPQ